MAEDVKALLDEQAKAWADFKKVNDARDDEVKKLGKATGETAEKLDRINKALDEQKAALDRVAAATKRPNVKGKDGAELSPEAIAHKRAFRAYARGGDVAVKGDMSDIAAAALRADLIAKGFDPESREMKTLSVDSDPNGGFMVPADMSGQIVTKIYETSEVRPFASVQTISTDSLDGAYDTDQVGSGWVAERATRTTTTTPAIGRWNIPVHELYAEPVATQKLLDDASIDVEAWLAGKVTDKFARDEATGFVLGTGSGQPRGFMTYTQAAQGTQGSQASGGSVQTVASGSSAAFVADKLFEVIYALKAGYRKNAVWGMPRLAIQKIRQLKDSQNRYLWEPSLQAGEPARLLNYPIAEFNDMATPAANSLSAVFGDLKRGYQIVDRMGIRVIRDAVTVKGQVLFYTTKRVGGDVINFEAFVYHKLG
jgi:HK97 family phage major capsid protein